MKLSIVIPAYNEEDTIYELINDIKFSFPDIPHEIIVVDDASTDNTRILVTPDARVLKNKINQGHAKSLLKGLKNARGQYILYMDADNQIKPCAIKYGFVSGYRVHRKDKFFRKVVSFILKMVILVRHGYYIRDANCPYKLIAKADLNLLLDKLPVDSVVPTISMSILARRLGLKTLEIPVEHYPLEKPRKGFLQSLNKKSLKMFRDAFWEVWNL